MSPLPKRRGGRTASAAASGDNGTTLSVEHDTWGSAAAAADPYQQQQMQQMQFSYAQQQQLGMPPDPARLAALAVREQQLAALQGVRMELESVRLLADQVNRREKLKKQVGFT